MAQIDRYTCQETFERLDDYLDRELGPEEMRLVVEHLEVCAYCILEFQFEARLLQDLRARVRAIPTPADLLEKVRGALDRVVNDPAGE
jgi:anti-sigma factor (TIGR02949 family)